MPGANCSLYGCGTSRKHKHIGIFKLPIPKDDFHRKWRQELIDIILQHRDLDDNLQRQISEDRVHICQRHFTEDQLYVYPSRKLLKEGAIPTLNLSPQILSTSHENNEDEKTSGRKYKRPHGRASPTIPYHFPAQKELRRIQEDSNSDNNRSPFGTVISGTITTKILEEDQNNFNSSASKCENQTQQTYKRPLKFTKNEGETYDGSFTLPSLLSAQTFLAEESGHLVERSINSISVFYKSEYSNTSSHTPNYSSDTLSKQVYSRTSSTQTKKSDENFSLLDFSNRNQMEDSETISYQKLPKSNGSFMRCGSINTSVEHYNLGSVTRHFYTRPMMTISNSGPVTLTCEDNSETSHPTTLKRSISTWDDLSLQNESKNMKTMEKLPEKVEKDIQYNHRKSN